jgi:hypothetical protein
MDESELQRCAVRGEGNRGEAPLGEEDGALPGRFGSLHEEWNPDTSSLVCLPLAR